MQDNTTDYLSESSPPETSFADSGRNVVRAAAHIAQGSLLLQRARRDSLSGNKTRIYSNLVERLQEICKAVERLGRSSEAP